MRQSATRTAPAPAGGAEREPSIEESAFRANPALFIDRARDWANGGEPPGTHHEEWLEAIPRRRIRQPEAAREAFWGLLAGSQRGRALAWLDKTGLLEDIIPIWHGDARLRSLRLGAVDELHRARWAKGLSKSARDRLNAFMDQKVDGRTDGWALSALATLLLESNGYTGRYNERLNEELRELGATEAERMRVMTAVIEYPFLRTAFKSNGEFAESRFQPTTIVAALSTLFADEKTADDLRARAVGLADRLLTT